MLRCSAPNKTADYQKIYSDWCNQFEKYKLALKTWEKRKGQCSPVPQIPQMASNEVGPTGHTPFPFLSMLYFPLSNTTNSVPHCSKTTLFQVFDSSRFF